MTRKQIEQCTWKWKDFLGLKNWDIVIVWKKHKTKNTSSEFPAIAKIETQSQYKLATIYYNPDQRKNIDGNAILHELLHAILAPLIEAARENNEAKLDYFHEQVTSELERIIMRLNNK